MRRGRKIILCFFLFLWTAVLPGALMTAVQVRTVPELTEDTSAFRDFAIDAERLPGGEVWKEKTYRQLAKDFLFYGGRLTATDASISSLSFYSMFLPEKKLRVYAAAFQTVLCDVRCFPVAEDPTGEETVSYENSWGTSRTYGGDRVHEGTDIMSSKNERGYFSVVSVSDGTVEKKGWLNLGGYRLGIRSPGGAYFYYAHLESYAADIEEGTVVKAGQVIGAMGDSGYGEEGTVGKFDVHLHFGIYLNVGEKEVSVNPYSVLKSLDET